jgi:hypothetical protein
MMDRLPHLRAFLEDHDIARRYNCVFYKLPEGFFPARPLLLDKPFFSLSFFFTAEGCRFVKDSMCHRADPSFSPTFPREPQPRNYVGSGGDIRDLSLFWT